MEKVTFVQAAGRLRSRRLGRHGIKPVVAKSEGRLNVGVGITRCGFTLCASATVVGPGSEYGTHIGT